MTDLYEELGVPRDADERAIRGAYRRKAKEHHPDRGGEPGAFHRIQTALSVLSNPARRRRYDETGEVEEKPVDNSRARALELIDAEIGPIIKDYMPIRLTPTATHASILPSK